MYQNRTETVKYVDTANTSHSNGLLNCGQMLLELGRGKSHHANHTRPTWNRGKIPAHITANTVIASDPRLMDVLHFCLRRHSIAEIRVPAWPMPIQKTKFTMAHPQFTGLLFPHWPTPEDTRTRRPIPVKLAIANAKMKNHHHQVGVFDSTIPQIFSVTQWKLLLLRTNGSAESLLGFILSRISCDGYSLSGFAELTVSVLLGY